MDQHGSRVVTVEIHGQQYPIRSGLDPAYVAELAAYVDEKMRLALRESPAGDTLKLAVLAALNIADEYFRAPGRRAAPERSGGQSGRRARTGAGPGARPRRLAAADSRPVETASPVSLKCSKILSGV